MKHLIILLTIFLANLSAQTYCAGEQMSTSHQNQAFEVCYASDDYSVGDSWSFADYNGDLNGGNYHIPVIKCHQNI